MRKHAKWTIGNWLKANKKKKKLLIKDISGRYFDHKPFPENETPPKIIIQGLILQDFSKPVANLINILQS